MVVVVHYSLFFTKMIPSITLAKAHDISKTPLSSISEKGEERTEKGWVERVKVFAKDTTSLQCFSVNLEGCRVTQHGLYREHRMVGTYPEKKQWNNDPSSDGYGFDFLVPEDSDAAKFFSDLKAVVEKLAGGGDKWLMKPVVRGENGDGFATLNLSRFTKLYVVGETPSFLPLSAIPKNILPKGSRLKSCLLSIAYFNKVHDGDKPEGQQYMCYPTFNVTHVFAKQKPTDLEIAKEMAARGNTTMDMADDDVMAAMGLDDDVVQQVKRQREEESLSHHDEVTMLTTPPKRRRVLETPGAPTKKPRS
jgi:hypothetical protein